MKISLLDGARRLQQLPHNTFGYPAIRCVRHAALFAIAVLSLTTPTVHAREYTLAAPPAWVAAIPVPAMASHPSDKANGKIAYLLRDQQTRVEQNGKTAYYHAASKALDGRGVEEIANIQVTFDPTYQTLAFNFVRVIRGSQVIEKLDKATIHVLQRETELDYQIYDGSKTASVVLSDIRVGDIVEYAYSLSGINPVFQNKVSGGAELQWSIPIQRVFVRFIAPVNRSFAITPHNTTQSPVVRERDGYREYLWDMESVDGMKVDEDTPSWFDPYPSVQWSEFADWSEVVRWTLPLYRTSENVSPALKREIDRIAKTEASADRRLLAVLRLVQGEIRYLGVEVGQSSHAPTLPSLVFERRFGDCKDKALLTVTMLRALGIEAQPALVNTDLRSSVGNWGATPNAFNHVIVRARMVSTTYWIDPTRPLQHGDIAHLYTPDYGYALVLDKDSHDLTQMAQPVSARKDIHAVFDSSRGLDQPVAYTVTTTVRGKNAESLRADIASRGKSALEKLYLNYYVRRYPDIKTAAPMLVQEDDDENAVTTTESYSIANFWPHSSKNPRREATIRIPDVQDLLRDPDDVRRQTPLAIKFPEDVIEVTEIRLPSHWPIKWSQKRVSDPAFEYSNVTAPMESGNGVILTDHYKSLADHVEPAAMAAYAEHLSTAYDTVGYWLYQNDGTTFDRKLGLPRLDIKLISYAVLGSLWAVLVLLLKLSPQEHLATNKRLVGYFVLDSACFAWIFLFSDDWRIATPIATLIVGISLGEIRKVMANASESHWIRGLARLGRPWMHRMAPNELTAKMQQLPKAIGWIAVGMLIMKVASK